MILIDSTKALGVHDVNIEDFIVLFNGDRLTVEPETSCACIHCRVYLKGGLLANEMVHEIRLASSVAASDADEGNLVMGLLKHLHRLLANLELALFVDVDKLDCLCKC